MPNLEDGYIKLFRSSIDNPLYKNPLVWHLWQHLLLRANHEENKIIWNGQEMVIERGSLITGRKIISLETGISERTIRTGLATLHSLGMIEKSTSKSTSKFSYLSICNYERFQSWNRTGDQQSDQQVTSNRPASDQQVTTNKNDKNDKNVKNINLLRDFESFWTEYPIKKEKNKALTYWKKLKPDIQIVQSALQIQINQKNQCDADGKFCPEFPYPERWIKNKRWEDEIDGPIEDMDPVEQIRKARLEDEERKRIASSSGKASIGN